MLLNLHNAEQKFLTATHSRISADKDAKSIQPVAKHSFFSQRPYDAAIMTENNAQPEVLAGLVERVTVALILELVRERIPKRFGLDPFATFKSSAL